MFPSFTAFGLAQAISAICFLLYGLSCVFSSHMVAEFERFGLADFRRLTGALEVLGALGIMAGAFFSPLLPFASGGLCALMALGIGVRIRVGDSLQMLLPAIFFFFLNGLILVQALRAS